MTHPLDVEIRARANAYIIEASSLYELSDWIAAVVWSLDDATNPAIADLAHGVMLAIAEGDGHDAAIKDAIRPLVSIIRATSEQPVRMLLGTGTTPAVSMLTTGSLQLGGRSPSAAFGSSSGHPSAHRTSTTPHSLGSS